jgi:hypothetical protein
MPLAAGGRPLRDKGTMPLRRRYGLPGHFYGEGVARAYGNTFNIFNAFNIFIRPGAAAPARSRSSPASRGADGCCRPTQPSKVAYPIECHLT